ERLALGVEYPGVARVDCHAGADSCLCEVHWSDVAMLQMGERVGQLSLEGSDELATRGGGRVGSALTANKDDAGGEGVTLSLEVAGILCPHWPGAADTEAGADHRIEESVPASARGACLIIRLSLPKGVVDGNGEGEVRLLGQAVHRLRHT